MRSRHTASPPFMTLQLDRRRLTLFQSIALHGSFDDLIEGPGGGDLVRRRSCPGGGQSGALISKNSLHLEIFLKAEDAMFATVARLLVAAEGDAPIDRRTVEINAPGAK